MKSLAVLLVIGFAITLEVLVLLGCQWISQSGPEWMMFEQESGRKIIGFPMLIAMTVAAMLPVVILIQLVCAIDEEASKKEPKR